MKRKKPRNDKYPVITRKAASKAMVIKEGKSRIYDLEERTAKFGEAIIEFAKKVPRDVIIKAVPALKKDAGALIQEAKELNFIFASIRRKVS